MTNFDSYWDDPSIDKWDKAYEIVIGDPDKMQKYGHPDDWGSETVDEILDEHEREMEDSEDREGHSDVYELAEKLYRGENIDEK